MIESLQYKEGLSVIKKIFYLVVSIALSAQMLLIGTPVYAIDTVTISGLAAIDQGTPTSLSVCFYPSDGTGSNTCFPADSFGNYTATIPSTFNGGPLQYNIDLEGVVGGLTFKSSALQTNNPQSGTLNMTLQTFTTTSVLRDQFGNLVSDAQMTMASAGAVAPYIENNIQYNSAGISVYNPSYTSWDSSTDTALTDSQGTATFQLLDNTNYNLSANPPSGTNYALRGANCWVGVITPTQTQPIVAWLQYPMWDTGNLTSRHTNTTPHLYWLPYPNTDHYDIYRWSNTQNGRVGWYLDSSYGTDYIDQTAVQEGDYHYSVVAINSSNNVLAVVEYQNFVTVNIDKTSPLVSGLTMSKTTINSKTGPVTITVASATDTTAMNTGEYYVDSDPGVGNGIPMTFNGTGLAATTTALANLSKGTHVLHARAVDMAGNWSVVLDISFSVR